MVQLLTYGLLVVYLPSFCMENPSCLEEMRSELLHTFSLVWFIFVA